MHNDIIVWWNDMVCLASFWPSDVKQWFWFDFMKVTDQIMNGQMETQMPLKISSLLFQSSEGVSSFSQLITGQQAKDFNYEFKSKLFVSQRNIR